MKFAALPLAGAWLIEPEWHTDARGSFARAVCREHFAAHGLAADFVQQSLSRNPHAGTLRGLHYQQAPHAENKLVTVTRGAVFDVIVDLRPGSPTHGRWTGVTLDADTRCLLYVPKGFAHGFQTLVDHTELWYQMTDPWMADAARGIRWDCAELAIPWPLAVLAGDPARLSPADAVLPACLPAVI